MAISNYKDLLMQGLNLPLTVEAKFPNAPKVSTYLTKANTNLPNTPNFPVNLPDLLALPALPNLGIKLPGGGSLAPPNKMFTKVTDGYQVIPPRTVAPTPGGGTATFLQTGKSTFTYK